MIPTAIPERAISRRNVVLDSMVETGAISASEATRAKAEPAAACPHRMSTPAKRLILSISVHDQLVQRISDQDLAHQSLRIYTSLDPDLQQVAS